MIVETRIGQGFDAHRFEKGRKLILGGVEIPHGLGLAGHSDADVLAHAVTDAVLGAAAMGDMGQHFPPGDPAWKDADSLELLARAVEMSAEAGCAVVNVDATVICESPKLSPHRDEMRENLARALGVEIGAVSVKSTTTEGMGFTGRGEGVAALAVCLSRPVQE